MTKKKRSIGDPLTCLLKSADDEGIVQAVDVLHCLGRWVDPRLHRAGHALRIAREAGFTETAIRHTCRKLGWDCDE